MQRLAIFCHYDKDNIIDDYVLLYLKALTSVATDIRFVSNSALDKTEQAKVKPYTHSITLRKNIGLDFGAWKEALQTIGLPYIATHYDGLILANDSCYAPFSPFIQLFNTMSEKGHDMWGITENELPHYISDNGEKFDITPHIQSYFLVFNKKILQAICFSDFWANVNPLSSRDDIIMRYEVGLTKLLREQGFSCSAYTTYQDINMENVKNIFGNPIYDLSIFCWHELLKRKSPFLKVKAIPLTLNWQKQELLKFSRGFNGENNMCSFYVIDKHLQRKSLEYQFSKISSLKKIKLFVQYFLNHNPSNIFAATRIKEYKKKIGAKFFDGGIKLVIKAICHKIYFRLIK